MTVAVQLRQDRAAVLTQAREITDRAKGGALSTEDKAQLERLLADARDRLTTIELVEEAEREHALLDAPLRKGIKPDPHDGGADNPTTLMQTRDIRALADMLASLGGGGLSLAQTEMPFERRDRFGRAVRDTGFWLPEATAERSPETRVASRDAFRRYLRNGLSPDIRNALQMDENESGGYLVPPEEFIARLIKFVDDEVFIRRLATVLPVRSSESLGFPSLEADPADADWTAEVGAVTADTAMKFGKRELHPHQLSKAALVSNVLLRRSPLPVEELVIQRLGYKFGITQEKNFLTGNGAGQPLGVFTASAMGIPTGRDFATGNTTTTVTFDGLKNAKYGLKVQYRRRAQWLFHRDGMSQIAGLKDGDGQYLWRESVRTGEPDMLMGLPFNESEYAPNTFTTGLYVGILGDFTQYWIADSLALTIQRLVELKAETNQVEYIGRLEADGMPVLAEAFARVKLA